MTDPVDGGCWYCHKDTPKGLVFDGEFDTNVHLECLRAALDSDPTNPEAKLMAYLLEREGGVS